MPLAPSSFLFLVVRPGAPSSVPAPSSDALSNPKLKQRKRVDVLPPGPAGSLLSNLQMY